MVCSLGQADGYWLTYETIDMASVPEFDVQIADTTGSEMTHYMPDVFPYHDTDAEYASWAMVNGELDFYVVMYNVYYEKIHEKSKDGALYYAGMYGNGDVDECVRNGYVYYSHVGRDKNQIGDFSGWETAEERSVVETYELKQVIWYTGLYENPEEHITSFTKLIGDDEILDFIGRDVYDISGDEVYRGPGILYNGYFENVEEAEKYRENMGKGLGLVEYDDCIVYYSK